VDGAAISFFAVGNAVRATNRWITSHFLLLYTELCLGSQPVESLAVSLLVVALANRFPLSPVQLGQNFSLSYSYFLFVRTSLLSRQFLSSSDSSLVSIGFSLTVHSLWDGLLNTVPSDLMSL